MTNREWLSTLTDEELAEWMLGGPLPVAFVKIDGVWYVDGEQDKLYPRLATIKSNSSQSMSAVKEWLAKEHVPLPTLGGRNE